MLGTATMMAPAALTSPVNAKVRTARLEWLIIILFILIFFGAKRLPEIAKGLGKGIREFKGALSGITDEIEKAGQTPVEPKAEDKEADTKED